MREFKFRVWDSERKEMLPIQRHSFKTGKSMPYGWNMEYVFDELMQYTGLKDKNESEIYDGDIVKIVTNEQVGEQKIGRNTFSKYGDVESIGIVRYGKCNYPYDKVSTWHIDTEHKIEYYTSFYQDKPTDKLVKTGKTIKKPVEIINDIEVVGNIYESPKMLDGDTNE